MHSIYHAHQLITQMHETDLIGYIFKHSIYDAHQLITQLHATHLL